MSRNAQLFSELCPFQKEKRFKPLL